MGYVRRERRSHLHHLRLRECSPYQHRQRGLLRVGERESPQLVGVELEVLLALRPHGVEIRAVVGALQPADVADDAANAVAPERARVSGERGALDGLLVEDVATHERVVVAVAGACEEVIRVKER